MALVEEKNKRRPATDGDNAVAFHSSNRQPVRIATNSRSTADNDPPDIGHDSDSETDSVFTNPSITSGPMGGDKLPDWLPPDPMSSEYTASQHLPRQMGHNDQSTRGKDSDSLAAASSGRMMSTPHRGLPPQATMRTPKASLSDLWDTPTPTHSSVLSQEGQEAVVRLRASKQRSSESSRVPQGRASLPLADCSKYQFEANSEDDKDIVPVEIGNMWLGRNANKVWKFSFLGILRLIGFPGRSRG